VFARISFAKLTLYYCNIKQRELYMSLTSLIAANQNTPFEFTPVTACQSAISGVEINWADLIKSAEESIIEKALEELGL
jgi:hypothetical protein